jgi:type III secretory pathway component EscR
MQRIKQHIIFRAVALVLSLAILVPLAVKFTHIFNHHKHQVCYGESTTHLHALDLECHFYKCKLNNQFFVSVNNISIPSIEDNYQIINSQYTFSSRFQSFHFSLRGPPQLI